MLGKSYKKLQKVTEGIKCIIDDKIEHPAFLGVNVGLEPVRNLSKSGLRPDYDDQDA